MSMTKVLGDIEQRAAEQASFEQGDYFADDGLLYCHKCHTPKQCRVQNPFFPALVDVRSCICKCREEELERQKENARRQEFLLRCDKYRRAGFADEKMLTWTFANDDMKNPQLTKAMQNYVEHFEEFKEQGKGLLLYGKVDGGKTYAACEVANALIDRGYPVLVTNFERLTNTLQGMFAGRQEYIDSLNKFALLVIDDLAAERDTEYMQGQVYNIIDARYRAGLPMIITTNLTGAEIKNPDSIGKDRIYSRLLERCHPIEVRQMNRRRDALKGSYADIKNILGI